tara:strand:- start:770 stop:1258 length:489 start_codon:yes stop_codon:yes gene_type:complete
MILCRYPVREITRLYRKEHCWKNIAASHGNTLLKNIKGDLFDIEVEFAPGQSDALGFKIHGKDIQYTTKTKTVVSCRTHPMKLVSSDGLIHLRILVDRTSIEVFCQRGAITAANSVLPLKNGSPPRLYINGGDAIIKSLKVRELKSIWPKNVARSPVKCRSP